MFRARFWIWLAALTLAACAAPNSTAISSEKFAYAAQLEHLLPADVLIVGEQHDVAQHQRIHLAIVQRLIQRQALSALALEMANAGASTRSLSPQANESDVKAALKWQDDAWPWDAYGPAVMAAVRAGVVVEGANLPDSSLRPAMADATLDEQLSGPALKGQQQAIRIGHCGLLPESQIRPMTRVQIARDISMAKTVASLVKKDQTVLLLTGNGHADRTLGVPLYLPKTFATKTVLLKAYQAQAATNSVASFDQTWPTEAAPPTDYCADFKASRATPTPLPASTR